MKMNKGFFRYLAYSLQVILLFVLQDTPKLMPEILGGKPLLLIPLALVISAYENTIPSMIFGAICGAFTDIGTGGIGFFAVMLTLVCYIESEHFRKFFVPSFVTVMVYSLLSVVLLIGLYFVVFRLFTDLQNAGAVFVAHYISRIIYTSVMVVPLFFLNGFLSRNLKSR